MKNILLTGCMGAGKTVVGRCLAQRLNSRFIDLDAVIETKAGLSISEQFERFGEAWFRDLEKDALIEVSKENGQVLATGGGIVLDRENRCRMKEMGTVVYLFARPEVLLIRTRDESHRPLLEQVDREEKIGRLLEQRSTYYEGADFTIDTSDLSVEEVTEQIIELFEEDLNG